MISRPSFSCPSGEKQCEHVIELPFSTLSLSALSVSNYLSDTKVSNPSDSVIVCSSPSFHSSAAKPSKLPFHPGPGCAFHHLGLQTPPPFNRLFCRRRLYSVTLRFEHQFVFERVYLLHRQLGTEFCFPSLFFIRAIKFSVYDPHPPFLPAIWFSLGWVVQAFCHMRNPPCDPFFSFIW